MAGGVKKMMLSFRREEKKTEFLRPSKAQKSRMPISNRLMTNSQLNIYGSIDKNENVCDKGNINHELISQNYNLFSIVK